MPEISLIVPVYKVEPYLHRCVDSILAQTFTDFELILVDDGSPDNCGAICDEYAQKDSRVQVIHQKNGGVSAARNAGLDYAIIESNSRWITFIDSDDWVHPTYLETLYHLAKENNVRISACMLQEVYEENSVVTQNEKALPVVLDAESAYVEYYEAMILSVLKLYDKSLFCDLRFPVGRVYGEDTFITHQLLFSCERVAIIPYRLYYYFQHSESVVHSSWKPKYLDDVEAHACRLSYLSEKGYRKAFGKEIQKYAGRIQHHIEKVKQSPWKGSKYERILRNKLRITLIQFRRMVSFSENMWIYEMAYPRLMNIYWIANAQLKKLSVFAGKK